MTAFDLVLRGGTVIDGTGAPGRPRRRRRARRPDPRGRRPVGASTTARSRPSSTSRAESSRPGSSTRTGTRTARCSSTARWPATCTRATRPSCRATAATRWRPITDAGRELVELSLRPNELVARWATFAEYLDRVAEQPLGPNVAFLVGHGTVRGSVLGADARPADRGRAGGDGRRGRGGARRRRDRASRPGSSTRPGCTPPPARSRRWSRRRARRGGLYATHMRNECDDLFASLDESIAAVRAAGPGARLQVSHLKCASRAVWGRAGEAVARLEAARAEGLDVAADQYPYTAAATTLATILPPALQGLGVDECVAALADPHVRDLVRAEIGARHLGLGERGRPTRAGRGSGSRTRPATRTGPAGRWPSSPTTSTRTRPTSPSTRWSTTGSTSRSSSTA